MRCALIPIIPLSSARASARHQMSGILADRELPSQCGILRRPDRGIPIYQIAGAYTPSSRIVQSSRSSPNR